MISPDMFDSNMVQVFNDDNELIGTITTLKDGFNAQPTQGIGTNFNVFEAGVNYLQDAFRNNTGKSTKKARKEQAVLF